jgi:hypothetical protein
MAATVSVKKWNDLIDVIDRAESALFGCELINWEELPELFASADDRVILRVQISVGEFKRLREALDGLNKVMNDPEYARVK